MLLFDALEASFRVIKLRPRQPSCCVCGDNPTITELQDYELFCGSSADDKVRVIVLYSQLMMIMIHPVKERGVKILEPKDRISCKVSYTVTTKLVDIGTVIILV